MASQISGYIGKLNPGNGTEYSLGSTAYGVCDTAAGTVAKTVEMTGFTLITGATIFVKFTNANSAANPTLNVNSTGAKALIKYGSSSLNWQAGAVLCLTYDGTSWIGNSVTLQDLGLSNAMHFIGKATVTITDGGTENPTITGYDFTNDRKPGDVVIGLLDGREYVWTIEGQWELLGQDASTTVDSGASTTNTWISRIQQNSDRTITVETGSLDTSGIWSGKLSKTFKIKLNNTQYTYDGSANVDLSTIYAPTAGGTANTQALVGNGATATPKWVNISPSISITAGTSSATPKVNVTVLGQSGTAQAITTATTGVYGATKLTDAYTSTDATLAATGKSILAAIQTLDVSAVGGGTGEYISKISETDGKIVATKTTTTVSNAWADGTTAGPTIKTTVNGIDGTAVAIPSASASVSGIVTTAAQTFAGDKTFQGNVFPAVSDSYDLGSTANYWNNAYIKNIIYSSGEANRLVWTDNNKLIKAANHYADATSIAINSTTIPTPPTGYPTYNLYINGDARSSGDLYFEGTNNRLAAFKLTTVGTVSRANIDMGWDWEKLDGAGAAFRSTDPNLAANQIGRFVLFARTTADDTAQLVGAPTGELSWKKVSGAARIGINADANANYNLYVNGTSLLNDVVRIGAASKKGGLRIYGEFDYSETGEAFDTNDRPSLTMSGNYPQIWLMSNANNSGHGATITLGGMATAGATSGSMQAFTIESSGAYAPTNLTIGYGTNANPHYNTGISSGYGTLIMRLTSAGRVGILTASPSYPLHVTGDMYTSGWARAASGFYCHDTGVHYTHNGNHGEINITKSNEMIISGNANTLYINYRAASRGTLVTTFRFHGGSSTSYSQLVTGHIVPGADNTYTLGSTSSLAWSYVCARNHTLYAGSAWYGDFYIYRAGTANSGDNNATRGTQGITLLRVGNNVAWPAAGTAGGANNSTGLIRLYAANQYYTEISAQGNGNRSFVLPNYNNTMYAVHAGDNNAVGSATQPVYVAANGRVTACTAYASAAVGYLSLPRVTQDYNTLPGNNLTMIKEYSNSSANRPTNHWYHAITSKGSDSAYATQFAMGMTITRLYYRNYSGSAWSAWKQVWIAGDAVTSAVWNDYAEYRETDTMEAGRCVMEVGDDSMILSTKRLQRGCSITSDTWGFAQGETEKAKTPIAVSGRVLAYPYESREEFASHIGWPVCSGPNGTVSIMTEEEEEKYPSRIVGIISAIPDYEEWGGGKNADRPPVKVNGRVWIKVK